MSFQKGVFGKTYLILLCLAGACLTHPAGNAAGTEEMVPAPSQVFTPRTALAIYADVQGAGQSAIWKVIADKAGPLVQQLQSLQTGQIPSLNTASAVPGINETNIAEIAVSFEGEKILDNAQSGQFDPDSGFIVSARLIGIPDGENLVQQILAAIDEKPGLRSQVEKSRRRVGSAAVFDVPAEVLGEQKLPFTVSFAVGPGKDGTIIGLGRSENVQAFLLGRTEGKLREQMNDTLSRRGQIWLYLPLPKDAAKSLGGGASELKANPMLAGLAQSMDKVRDVRLSLKFGASQVDLALDLGCSDGAAASQLAQVIQGFLGMVQQLGAQKNAASVPPFVGKIRVRAEGAVFRFATAFTIRDFDLAFQNASRGVASAVPRVSSQTPKSEAAPAPVTESTPVDVEFVRFSSIAEESLRSARMRVQNRSSKPVKELRLTFIYSDQSGRRLGQWTRNHSSLTSDNLIDGEKTQVVDCLAFNVPLLTKKVAVTLHEVTFADGAKWSPRP
jgi:hypothetical protein